MVGARVASITTVEAGPSSSELGKLRGPVLSMSRTDLIQPRVAEKRAFRRARLRAGRMGGTWYRGRWHTAASLQALPYKPKPTAPRTVRQQQRASQAHLPQVRSLSWNAGGLTSAVYQEFMAWLETQGTYQIAVLQETHWPSSCDYVSGGWFCIHSAGDPQQSHDRYAGLLVMLSKHHFKDPVVHEVQPGRVLHVRACYKQASTDIDLVAIYQHVWRTHLSTQENRDIREVVWSAIEHTLARIPLRNILHMCGDFNSCLAHSPPGVGPAARSTADAHADSRLEQLIHEHQLCALNTWSAKPSYTFHGPKGCSQIDFILTRRHTAGGISKQARPLTYFPVAAWRASGHHPIQAQLPVAPPQRCADFHGPRLGQCDKAALLQAMYQHDPKVEELQQAVQRELPQADTSDLHALHQCINTTLCQVAERLFPTRRSPDARLSAQVGFRASARHTWQLYAQYRRARVATLGHIVQKWRLAAQFFRASRALRDQSKALKRQAFQAKLLQAEQAAATGGQRTLHQIVNSLAPNHRKVFSRLRGKDGKLLSKPEEAKALVAQGASTYAQYPDLPITEPLSQCLHIADAEVVSQLNAIKASKAVPKHIAPAAIWKICASTLGPLLARAFNHHFQEGRMGLLQGDLTDASMVMLPKVGKPAHLLENLRPIGLMAPPSKSLAGVLRNRMMEWQLPRLQFRPQFAYTPNRGTFDALLRVHKHVEDAMTLFRSNRISRFGQHGGRKPLPFVGALSLSLDLSRAFDLTDRQMLFQALPQYGIPPEVVEVARRLHYGAKFIYKAGDCAADFIPTNGLKQGCKVAPCLWV